jgi:FKBP-type peptidyl-prolyl cis-trans isomerase SlyD
MSISKNTIVTLQCRIIDTEGNLIDGGNEPLIYLHGGYGQIFLPFEEAMEGKNEGDQFRIVVKAADAFGEYDADLIVTEPLDELPEGLSVGMEIDGYMEETPDDTVLYRVIEIKDGSAVLDANHPLAGVDLVFEGSVTEITPADDETIRTILEHHHHH